MLKNKTRGCKKHPQLERFKAQKNPAAAINAFLFFVEQEACARKHCFDKSKLERPWQSQKIPVTKGQLGFEFSRLKKKLGKRSPGKYNEIRTQKNPEPNPLFKAIKGGTGSWSGLAEKLKFFTQPKFFNALEKAQKKPCN